MKRIKVFSDFACPFCYIGFSIADRLIKENSEVEFLWYPYELDSQVAEEGASLEDGIPKEQIDMAYRRIERLGSEYGLIYSNKTTKFNTGLLHRAALYAQEVGSFYPFAKEAFKAIFEEGKNVALKEVVNQIGIDAGLNIHEMIEAIEAGEFEDMMENSRELAAAHEIESVPTFIREDGVKVTLLKGYEKFNKNLLE
ncbi:MAG: DsbA family protein [Gudongella sp.]|nr:DsbA family protein [Gudongella sp.]